jgi:hypothetical protein
LFCKFTIRTAGKENGVEKTSEALTPMLQGVCYGIPGMQATIAAAQGREHEYGL